MKQKKDALRYVTIEFVSNKDNQNKQQLTLTRIKYSRQYAISLCDAIDVDLQSDINRAYIDYGL